MARRRRERERESGREESRLFRALPQLLPPNSSVWIPSLWKPVPFSYPRLLLSPRSITIARAECDYPCRSQQQQLSQRESCCKNDYMRVIDVWRRLAATGDVAPHPDVNRFLNAPPLEFVLDGVVVKKTQNFPLHFEPSLQFNLFFFFSFPGETHGWHWGSTRKFLLSSL